ncbi:hypothetical protein HDU67_002044 [Dinochytrium kinnereticum]|nr:hypothetical protein HDU67_002044 [Dinochytrium kinnereticum]
MHLIVLHNGLWGTHKHLTFLSSQLQRAHDEDTQPNKLPIEILNCSLNEGIGTYHGVDGCGKRLAEAIISRLEEDETKPRVTHISLIGYSLGGLIVRYAIGVLYAQGWLSPSSSQVLSPRLIRRHAVKAVRFATFASPHLGAVRKTGTMFDRVFNAGAVVFTGRSGSHVFLRDGKGRVVGGGGGSGSGEVVVEEELVRGRNMVAILSDPRLPFWKGLAMFASRTVYTNIQNDPLISLESGSFMPTPPFDSTLPPNQRYLVTNPRYPSLVEPPPSPNSPSAQATSTDAPTVASDKNSQASPLSSPSPESTPDNPDEKPPTPALHVRIGMAMATPVFLVMAVSGLTGYLLGYYAQGLTRSALRVYSSARSQPDSRRLCNVADEGTSEWVDDQGRPVSSADTVKKLVPTTLEIYYKVDWWLGRWVAEHLDPLEASASGLVSVGTGGQEEGWTASTDTVAFSMWALNLLSWNRFHVLSKQRRSHATIVRREDKFSGNEDVVEHFADTFFEVL